jgi:hypothetical protein
VKDNNSAGKPFERCDGLQRCALDRCGDYEEMLGLVEVVRNGSFWSFGPDLRVPRENGGDGSWWGRKMRCGWSIVHCWSLSGFPVQHDTSRSQAWLAAQSGRLSAWLDWGGTALAEDHCICVRAQISHPQYHIRILTVIC